MRTASRLPVAAAQRALTTPLLRGAPIPPPAAPLAQLVCSSPALLSCEQRASSSVATPVLHRGPSQELRRSSSSFVAPAVSQPRSFLTSRPPAPPPRVSSGSGFSFSQLDSAGDLRSMSKSASGLDGPAWTDTRPRPHPRPPPRRPSSSSPRMRGPPSRDLHRVTGLDGNSGGTLSSVSNAFRSTSGESFSASANPNSSKSQQANSKGASKEFFFLPPCARFGGQAGVKAAAEQHQQWIAGQRAVAEHEQQMASVAAQVWRH